MQSFRCFLVAVVLASLTGCTGSGADGGAGTGSAAPPTTTMSASASSPGDTSLPAGWRRCDNPHRGVSMGYPADWHTDTSVPDALCTYFHPEPFRAIRGDSFSPLVALTAFAPWGTTDSTIAFYAANHHHIRVLMREDTTVAGRRAVRFETEGMNDPPFDRGVNGVRRYGYIIDRDGSAFMIEATAAPGEGRYAEWKTVADQAMRSLQFQPGWKRTPPPG